MKKCILSLSLLALFAGCEKAEETPVNESQIEINEQALIPSPLPEAGGNSVIQFVAKTNWSASVNTTKSEAWCSISPTSGSAGNVSLNISAKPNDTFDERNAAITLRAGSDTKTITVNQKQKDALTVTSAKFETKPEGETIDIEIKANISFGYTILESAKAWITPVTTAQTKAIKASHLTFRIAANENTEKREGSITIASGAFQEIVKVYQQGSKPQIILTQNQYTVPGQGDKITVEIKTNVNYQVILPDDAPWITEPATRAMSAYTRHFVIAANETYDARSAQIEFVNQENNLTETVTVTQIQKDGIVITQPEYTFDCKGGRIEMEVMTNVELSVETDDSSKEWIQRSTAAGQTKGLEKKMLYFTIAPHQGQEPRVGEITIKGGTATQKVKVNQLGIKALQEKERKALIAFYNATNGSSWANHTHWCSDKPVGEWYGVITNEQGCVTKISLNKNNLTGSLTSELGILSCLESLDFSENQLTGTIPETIGNLTKLDHLSLAYNNLTGNIPVTIGNLTKLSTLSLCNNNLTGNIPETIGNLTELVYLALSDNNLTGNIPESICQCTKMSILYLFNNHLSGNIPAQIGNCFTENCRKGDVSYLNLSNNQLTGSIPASVAPLLDHCNYKGYPWVLFDQASAASPQRATKRSDIKAPKASAPLLSSKAVSYDFSRSIINAFPEIGADFVVYHDCDGGSNIQFENNNLGGVIPQAVTSKERWNGFPGWSALNQNEGYGFDLASANLSIPDFVQCSLMGGGVFTKESCKEGRYTILIDHRSVEGNMEYFADISARYQDKGFKVCFFNPYIDEESFNENIGQYMNRYGLKNWKITRAGDNFSPKYGYYPFRYVATFSVIWVNTLFVFDENAKLVFHSMMGGDQLSERETSIGEYTAGYCAHLEALDAFLAEHLK